MFMIFGIITVLFGISLWWILPDSPVTAKFLNDHERLIAIERLKDNKTGVKNTHHKKPQIKETLLDPKIWLLVVAIFFHNMTNSLQSNFTGLIIVGFGYSTDDAVLLSIPPGIVQVVTMILVSFCLSTKWGQENRMLLIITCYLPGVACCLILYLSSSIPPHAPRTFSQSSSSPSSLSPPASPTHCLPAMLPANAKKTIAGDLLLCVLRC